VQEALIGHPLPAILIILAVITVVFAVYAWRRSNEAVAEENPYLEDELEDEGAPSTA
jgi:hypothetical protein